MERSEHKFLDELGLAEAEYFKYSAKADPQQNNCFNPASLQNFRLEASQDLIPTLT